MWQVHAKVKARLTAAAQVILSFRCVPPGTSNELLANLWMYRNRLASLDYDKVYGVLGLLKTDLATIQPDYEKPFPELCRSVVLADIQASGNLHALKGIRTLLDVEQTSWCTDWSDLDFWTEDQSRVLTELYKQLYAASDLYKARVHRPIDRDSPSGILLVAGRIYDSVDYITDLLPFRSDMICASTRKQLSRLKLALQKLQGSRKDREYIAGGSVFSAFWRTLIGDCILPYREGQDLLHAAGSSTDDNWIPSIRRATPVDLLAFLLWWIGAGKGSLLQQDSFAITASGNKVPRQDKQSASYTSNMIKKLSAVRDIHASIIRATSGRRMFVTKNRYVGLGPEHTRVGDSVALLLGGSTPFVLRGVEQQWMVLGDCYVHGAMDGEFVKDGDAANWPMLELV